MNRLLELEKEVLGNKKSKAQNWRVVPKYGNISRAASFDPVSPSNPGNPLVNTVLRNNYKDELQISGTLQNGSSGKDVKKVQEWLNLWKYIPANWTLDVTIDSDFGPNTESAVKAFQKLQGQPETGIVDSTFFEALTNSMRWAYTKITSTTNIRDLVVSYAQEHLTSVARELRYKGEGNQGPWVRSYMYGRDGDEMLWCAGFVQTILDLAYSTIGKDYRNEVMTKSNSCANIHDQGKAKKLLINHADIPAKISEVKPGDIFILWSKRKVEVVENGVKKIVTKEFWGHIGIITGVEGDYLLTIEGNTDGQGSREGDGVYTKRRNYKTRKTAIFKLGI